MFLASLIAAAAAAASPVTLAGNVYWGRSCDGTAYSFALGVCQQFRTASFKAQPQACDASGVAMDVAYWNSSTTCAGAPSETAAVQKNTCQAVGQMSITGRVTGLSDAEACSLLSSLTTVAAGSLNLALYTDSPTCGGACYQCESTPFSAPEVTRGAVECVGCCRKGIGQWWKSYSTCVNINGTNMMLATDHTFTDAACSTEVPGSANYQFVDAECRTTSYGSARFTLTPADVTQAFCSAVSLMQLHNFTVGNILPPAQMAVLMPYTAPIINESDPISPDL